MTLDEIITSVRFKTNISNTATLSDAEIITEINPVILDIFRAIVETDEDYFEEQRAKFNLGENSAIYSLPTDCVKFKQLRLAYSTPSSESDYRVCQSFDVSETGLVSADEENVPVSSPIVDLTNNYYRIKPTPISAVTNGGMIYYIARPSAMTAANSADEPVIPEDYHDLVAVKVAARVHERFENFPVSDRYYNQYLAGIERMKEQLEVREINREFRMRDPRAVNKSDRQELPSS